MESGFVMHTANQSTSGASSTMSLGSRNALAIVVVLAVVSMPAQAQTLNTLHTFTGPDGSAPAAGVVRDSAGNLYGTTFYGGAYGLGVVFKLDTSNKETVLYSFAGGSDGANPYAGLILDSAGNFYGTTTAGGSPVCQCGTIFKLSSSGRETVLYRFRGGTNGAMPWSDLISDSAGNLYGTTTSGGHNNYGTVFKLSNAGEESVLYRFRAGSDGAVPIGGLIRDSEGNLYGTTSCYEVFDCNGALFEIDTSNRLSVLWAVGDSQADLAFCYGESICGTEYQCEGGNVWKYTLSGTFTVLYSSTDYNDGCDFASGVVQDDAGNLYGTASGTGVGDFGTLYEVFAGGGGNTLYSFFGYADGGYPQGNLVLDKQGNLYGTTYSFGDSDCQCGTVYKFTP